MVPNRMPRIPVDRSLRDRQAKDGWPQNADTYGEGLKVSQKPERTLRPDFSVALGIGNPVDRVKLNATLVFTF